MNYRYERKFVIENFSLSKILSIIKSHPSHFKEIFLKRRVNNIYLDSINTINALDNLSGIAKRRKVRVRWYGNTFGAIKNPKLELKKKYGEVGEKKSWELEPFYLDNNFSQEFLETVFKKSDNLGYRIKILAPLKVYLLNSYQRLYYSSADNNYRITVDYNLNYYKLSLVNNNFSHQFAERNKIILELKYPHNKDDNANIITNKFPFRLNKFSKYINGLQELHPF